jgi:hypothetical protein
MHAPLPLKAGFSIVTPISCWGMQSENSLSQQRPLGIVICSSLPADVICF